MNNCIKCIFLSTLFKITISPMQKQILMCLHSLLCFAITISKDKQFLMSHHGYIPNRCIFTFKSKHSIYIHVVGYTKQRKLINFNLRSYNAYDLASQRTNNRKHGFMLSPQVKRTFESFRIHLVTSNDQQLSGDKLFH
jgi:hypothetical protein